MSALGIALALGIGISLGFFGGGGSILAVPLFVYIFRLEPKEAIASSFLVVAMSSVSAVIQHWRADRVDLRTGLMFGASGMVGAHLGGRASVYLDDAVLLLLFASTMLVSARAMWRGRAPSRLPATPSPARLLVQGFAVGIFTGLIGAGGGFVIVPALVLLAGLPTPTAIGTSLFVLVMQSLAGFSGYATHVTIHSGLVAAVGFSAIAGTLLGARATRLLEPGILRCAFAGFIVVVSLFIFSRESGAWVPVLRDALPVSMPQSVLVLVVLGLGVALGRASLHMTGEPLAGASKPDLQQDGSGI